jgi:primosomal protein N' (replication factor Y)
LRAESVHPRTPHTFLAAVHDSLTKADLAKVEVLGPAPPPMERRAGRYRAQLLFHSSRRGPLHRLLDTMVARLQSLPQSGKVRWSLDVDPIDEY